MSTFVNNDVASGAIIYAADHNEQGSRIAAVLNGGLDNNNISGSAAIDAAKLANGSIATAKIADSAVTSEKITSTVAFEARRTTDQSSIATGTVTKVQCATEVYDYGSNYDAATNYEFTAPYKGVYHFDARVSMDAAGTWVVAYLYVNNAAIKVDRRYSHTASDDNGAALSVDILLNQGDKVDVRVEHNAGSARTLIGSMGGENFFNGHLVGRVA